MMNQNCSRKDDESNVPKAMIQNGDESKGVKREMVRSQMTSFSFSKIYQLN